MCCIVCHFTAPVWIHPPLKVVPSERVLKLNVLRQNQNQRGGVSSVFLIWLVHRLTCRESSPSEPWDELAGGVCVNSVHVCVPRPHSGPCWASYLARMFLVRPSSFRRSATSCLRAEFSFSRKLARMAIWFSLRRRASRERLAAKLFFLRRAQYLSSCSKKSGKQEGLLQRK